VARMLALGAAPDRILAFTFTNRAAKEMRARLESSVGEAARRLWVGTFHGICLRLLRREAGRLGLPRDFAIYDREDQETVLRGLFQRMQLSETAFRPGPVLNRISDAKNALVPPSEVMRLAVSPWERSVAEVYAAYQEELRRNAALDFDDLIAEAVRLLQDDPEAGRRWAARFEHVLVDEYQDTNHAQFRLIRALSGVHGSVFVVGDDDQSIYGWRGADLSNVLDFERAFPGATVLRLEQNYRSTGNILKAANAVIANNQARKGKTLWCEREDGPRLRFVLASDEEDEARRVRAALDAHVARGGRYDQCAVLYRTNAQSRAFETELRHRGIAYEIVGGVAFYQRREVKDVLAYLRLAVNPADTVAFWRIWNTPRRGLGPAVRAQIEMRDGGAGVPLEALRALIAADALRGPARGGAAALIALMDRLAGMRDAPVEEVFRVLLESSGYKESLGDPQESETAERIANLEELVTGAVSWAEQSGGTLGEYLVETALLTDVDRMSEALDRVLLLTAHNAKGLEFPVVIVAGLEEGLLPHGSSSDDSEGLEEERRLFYVALTRAQNEVLLTAAAYRRRFDGARGGQISRFVDEIPEMLLERIEPPRAPRAWGGGNAERAPWRGGRDGVAVATPVRPVRSRSRAAGREVWHETFGRGRVLDAEGEGPEARYTVQFAAGVKKVVGRFLSGGGDDDPA
ncbi:MAG TPA: UvrD-helicase domain-containing protein, partial [Myxococcales bacterium]|nr:UvrD-helicase domain-containing protein [Myxococcales bacterium]